MRNIIKNIITYTIILTILFGIPLYSNADTFGITGGDDAQNIAGNRVLMRSHPDKEIVSRNTVKHFTPVKLNLEV